MIIKVLGSGCSKCKKLEENVQKATRELEIEASIEKIKEIDKFLEYGVMKTPALVIDEQVKVMGRVPDVEEIKKYFIVTN